MKREFTFCEHCAEDAHNLERVEETSAAFDYCAAGHFFNSSNSETDGRPKAVNVSLEVGERETITEPNDPSKSTDGGDYFFYRCRVRKGVFTNAKSHQYRTYGNNRRAFEASD